MSRWLRAANTKAYYALKKSGELYTAFNEGDIIAGAFDFSKSQSYGSIIEQLAITKYNLTRLKSKAILGDAKDSHGVTYEIKGSISDSGVFNVVQIRPDHLIDIYLFVFYDLTIGRKYTEIQPYTLFIPKKDLIALKLSNAHGVKGKDIHADAEKRLTVKMESSLWDMLISNYRKEEEAAWEVSDNLSFI